MPLDVEQESKDLLQKALDRLRQRLDASGGYEQREDMPFDQLDRILGSALDRRDYAGGIEQAKTIAPDLLSRVLGGDADRLERMNYMPAEGRNTSGMSGPMQLAGGELGRVLGNQWIPVMRQSELPTIPLPPSWAVPSAGTVDPGFSYMKPGGSPEDELLQREIWRQSDAGKAAAAKAQRERDVYQQDLEWNQRVASLPLEPVIGQPKAPAEMTESQKGVMLREFNRIWHKMSTLDKEDDAEEYRVLGRQLNDLRKRYPWMDAPFQDGAISPAGTNSFQSGKYSVKVR